MDQAFIERLVGYAGAGMVSAFWAQVKPDRVAVWDRFGEHTYKKVNGNSNRLARLLRKDGLKPGDSVALFCCNRAEFVEISRTATRRIGLRITPVNWHLAATRSPTSSTTARPRRCSPTPDIPPVHEPRMRRR